MASLTTQVGILSFSNFSRLFIKTVIGFVLARTFTQQDYGSYQQLHLLFNTFSVFILLGIPQSILFFLPKFTESSKRFTFISQSVFLVFLLGLIFSVLLIVFRDSIAGYFNNPDLDMLLAIYFIYPAIIFVSSIYNFIMLSFQKPRKVLKFTLFSVGMDAILILGPALITHNILYSITGLIFSALIQFGYVIFAFRNYFRNFKSIDKASIKEQLEYSLPIGLSGIVSITSLQLDKFIISGAFRPDQYAVFAVGAMEIPLVANIRNAIYGVLLPALAKLDLKNDSQRIIRLYSESVRKFALFLFPLIVFLFLFAEDFIVLAYSSKYAEASTIFRLYLLILPMRVANYTLLLQAFGYTKPIFQGSLIGLVINFILGFTLIKLIGFNGPAIATVITNWSIMVFFVVVILKKTGLPIFSLFATKEILKIFLVAAVSILAVYPLESMDIIVWVKLPLAFTIYVVIFNVIGIGVRVINTKDIILIKGYFKNISGIKKTR